jgi:hypothetical protein
LNGGFEEGVGWKVAGDGRAFPHLPATSSGGCHIALIGARRHNVLASLSIIGVINHFGVGDWAKGRVLVAVGEVHSLATALVDYPSANPEGEEHERSKGVELHLDGG